MALASLTREGVLAAVAEFDRLGRDEFLRASGFGKAKSYFLDLDGVLYDSKGIAGWALGLGPDGFHGGDRTVAARLRKLGFTARFFPVLPWIREEIVLACAVVEANGWKQPTAQTRDPRVLEVSALLQSPVFHPADQHGPDFRNPASVARKMADIVTNRPGYEGGRTHGNRLDRVVAQEFQDRPAEMHAEAARIRARLLKGGEVPGAPPAWEAARPLAAPGGVDVRDVPVEAHYTADFEVRGRSERIQATRREAQLVQRYRAWLAEAGCNATAKQIVLDEHRTPLRIDLYDDDRAEIIEAKGSAERDYIRFALGQILDYARYVPHKRLAVLLPARPREDLVVLLRRHGISCIYETEAGSFDRVSAESDATASQEIGGAEPARVLRSL